MSTPRPLDRESVGLAIARLLLSAARDQARAERQQRPAERLEPRTKPKKSARDAA